MGLIIDTIWITKLLHIISHHNLSDVFGVSLLHKHFNLGEHEILVERQLAKESWIVPQLAGMYNFAVEPPEPYMYKVVFNDQTQTVTLYPLEFIENNDQVSSANRLLSKRSDFVNDFTRVLHNNNLTEYFGFPVYIVDI